jgi:hypothetical protein
MTWWQGKGLTRYFILHYKEQSSSWEANSHSVNLRNIESYTEH